MRKTWFIAIVAAGAAAFGCGSSAASENCGLSAGGAEVRFCSPGGDQVCVCATNRCARADDVHCVSGFRYVWGSSECVPEEIVSSAIASASARDRCETADGGDGDADGDVEPDGDGGDVEIDGDADGDVEPDGADGDSDVEIDGDVEPDGDGGDVEIDGDGGDVPTVLHSVMTMTSGGGTAAGGGVQLTISVGTPQPMGTRSGTGHEVRLGPGAVQNQ